MEIAPKVRVMHASGTGQTPQFYQARSCGAGTRPINIGGGQVACSQFDENGQQIGVQQQRYGSAPALRAPAPAPAPAAPVPVQQGSGFVHQSSTATPAEQAAIKAFLPAGYNPPLEAFTYEGNLRQTEAGFADGKSLRGGTFRLDTGKAYVFPNNLPSLTGYSNGVAKPYAVVNEVGAKVLQGLPIGRDVPKGELVTEAMSSVISPEMALASAVTFSQMDNPNYSEIVAVFHASLQAVAPRFKYAPQMAGNHQATLEASIPEGLRAQLQDEYVNRLRATANAYMR